jgi:Skp family chaperone for outer membrane proteins
VFGECFMMKKMSLLLGLIAAASITVADAKKESVQNVLQNASRVYCNPQTVFQLSSAGQDIAHWSAEKNKMLQEVVNKEQKNLQTKEQEIAASQPTADQIPLKKLELEHIQRQATLNIEKMKTQLEAELNGKMKTVEAEIKKTISEIATQNNWAEVLNPSDTNALYFAPSLDVTTKVLEAFNKDTRAKAAKDILRSDSQKTATDILKA